MVFYTLKTRFRLCNCARKIALQFTASIDSLINHPASFVATSSMGDVEYAVTKSWASIFIDTTNKQQLLYEDLIEIYHVMNNLKLPGA